jgi:hypothetical protein
MTAPRTMLTPRNILIALLAAAIFGPLLLFGAVWLGETFNALSPAPSPTPKLPPTLEQKRSIAAHALQLSLQEGGCKDCKAWASGTALEVVSAEHAPRDAAAGLLGDRKTVEGLKSVGFTTLRVRQELGGQAFAYRID